MWGGVGGATSPLGGAAPPPQPVCEKKEGDVAMVVLRGAASVLARNPCKHASDAG